jgi:ribosomal protein S11
MNYKYLKIKNFKIKRNTGKLFIKRTYSNIFITLTDLNNKVIICKTSGSSDKIYNKRKKKVPQAVDKIIFNIKNYFNLYNIKYIHIIIKMKIKSHIYNLLSKLNIYGIDVLSIKSRKKLAHNGIKGRKLRRL